MNSGGVLNFREQDGEADCVFLLLLAIQPEWEGGITWEGRLLLIYTFPCYAPAIARPVEYQVLASKIPLFRFTYS